MGELNLDKIERLLVPEWQNEHECDSIRKQNSKANKDFQRGQLIPVSQVWPSTTYGKDDRGKSLLPRTC
jgi:hypothetical protein